MTCTRYKILAGDTQPYFVTATTVNWLPLFSNPDIAGILFASPKFLQDHQSYSSARNYAGLQGLLEVCMEWAEADRRGSRQSDGGDGSDNGASLPGKGSKSNTYNAWLSWIGRGINW